MPIQITQLRQLQALSYYEWCQFKLSQILSPKLNVQLAKARSERRSLTEKEAKLPAVLPAPEASGSGEDGRRRGRVGSRWQRERGDARSSL